MANTSQLFSQFFSLGLFLVVMQLGKRYDFGDPAILPYLRGMYILSSAIVFLVYKMIEKRIKKKNDLAVLKYVEQPQAFSGKQEGQLVNTTVCAYDISELEKAMKSVVIGCAMTAFMHLYMKYSQPLIVQSIMPFKTLYDQHLFKIHILGRPAQGDLKRPFKAQNGLFGAAGASQTRTDKKSIEQLQAKAEVKKDI